MSAKSADPSFRGANRVAEEAPKADLATIERDWCDFNPLTARLLYASVDTGSLAIFGGNEPAFMQSDSFVAKITAPAPGARKLVGMALG